ncbi:serine protease inhibitor 88Ea [Drosophila subpulchrella]|uniref:serine protease inhibitor 88Ea n=1 Tax=Drosophila subpulchrella TaxID=1486046 RepID=UPI0018A12935|nr:serine protease inhibitor 88Ea [Drosophila subpulchrella]XP_037716115.1 serine protease inhibitor 88Ea [Drosophila subpulchrella]
MHILSLSVMVVVLPAIALAGLCDVAPDANLLDQRLNLYKGQQNFAVSMLDAIRQSTPNENVFFSPYSTYHAMLLAYFGSTGETEKELAKVLHLDWADSKEVVRSAFVLEKKNRKERQSNMPLEFSSADRIFFANDLHLTDCAQTRLAEEIRQLDFKNQPEESRKEINDWIAKETHDQIRNMLSADEITPRTRLVLANAAYLKGQWLSQFKTEKTAPMPFYTSPSNFSLVSMMQQKGTFLLNVDEQLRAHVLQLPYRTVFESQEKEDSLPDENSDISMVLILPPFNSNSLEDVLSRLNADSLDESLKQAMPREIEVSLPKFEFEQRLELNPILAKMGIKKMFDQSTATFDDLTSETISIGDSKHVAKIKVDEEGSTAAAATVLFTYRSARPVEPAKFECNHPFLFVIYDRTSRAILFTGIYRDPKTVKQ